MPNPNTNCLEGMSCPKCQNFGPFVIAVSTFVCVSDDGTDGAHGDIEWGENSSCHCVDCDHTATVADFREDERGTSSTGTREGYRA
jgi:hypothetical protein